MSESSVDEAKIFNDPIHGTIVLHSLLVKIIDTPQFQRLRNIKQLGSVYFVFPGASHNRFEHSIGTAYLAGKVVRLLKEKQSYLGIDKKDILCVEIAALCHDLGKAPYSHMFETMFMPQFGEQKFNHEKVSITMFDFIYEKLKNYFRNAGLMENDITFIRELINPKEVTKVWKYKGRGEDKCFLYDIVANKQNGVDVDKWDYLARDCYHLGIANTFDYNRFLNNLKIFKITKGRRQICAKDTEAINLYGMFNLRCKLQYKAYKHRVSNAIDHMICDAFILVEDSFGITYSGKDKYKKLKISECVDDAEAFTKFDDSIIETIMQEAEGNEIDQNLKRASGLLNRIKTRLLYKCVGTIRPLNQKEETIRESIVSSLNGIKLTKKKLAVTVLMFDFGMDEKNPMKLYYFFSKNELETVYQLEEDNVSVVLPEMFQKNSAQIFCKKAKYNEIAEKCIESFCMKQGILRLSPKGALSPTRRKFVVENEEVPESKSSKK